MRPTVLLVATLALAACSSKKDAAQSRTTSTPRPDEWPSMINAQPPFHYPAALYARKLQGNVTLRLFIDVNGLAVADSTRVEEKSGHAEFDSAAVAGAGDLRFVPAKLHGEPIAVTILFPVYFRHPEAPPMAGDTALKRTGTR
jgi:TonB family protein